MVIIDDDLRHSVLLRPTILNLLLIKRNDHQLTGEMLLLHPSSLGICNLMEKGLPITLAPISQSFFSTPCSTHRIYHNIPLSLHRLLQAVHKEDSTQWSIKGGVAPPISGLPSLLIRADFNGKVDFIDVSQGTLLICWQ